MFIGRNYDIGWWYNWLTDIIFVVIFGYIWIICDSELVDIRGKCIGVDEYIVRDIDGNYVCVIGKVVD